MRFKILYIIYLLSCSTVLISCNSGNNIIDDNSHGVNNVILDNKEEIRPGSKDIIEPLGDLEKRTFINHLTGDFKGMVYLAQTHVVSVYPRPFDPLIIPNREALVILLPESGIDVERTTLKVEVNGRIEYFDMYLLNQFNGPTMVSSFDWHYQDPNQSYAPYTTRGWAVQIPWYLVQPGIKLSFEAKLISYLDERKIHASLDTELEFLQNMDYEFVNAHIFGCLYADSEDKCYKTGNARIATGNSKQHNLNKIAARETYAQFPYQRLINSAVQIYVPYVLYKEAGLFLEIKSS